MKRSRSWDPQPGFSADERKCVLKALERLLQFTLDGKEKSTTELSPVFSNPMMSPTHHTSKNTVALDFL